MSIVQTVSCVDVTGYVCVKRGLKFHIWSWIIHFNVRVLTSNGITVNFVSLKCHITLIVVTFCIR